MTQQSPLQAKLLHGLSGFSFAELMAVVAHAGRTHPMRKPKCTTLGASGDAGILQLPHGAAPLVPALLGHFTLRDCHL